LTRTSTSHHTTIHHALLWYVHPCLILSIRNLPTNFPQPQTFPLTSAHLSFSSTTNLLPPLPTSQNAYPATPPKHPPRSHNPHRNNSHSPGHHTAEFRFKSNFLHHRRHQDHRNEHERNEDPPCSPFSTKNATESKNERQHRRLHIPTLCKLVSTCGHRPRDTPRGPRRLLPLTTSAHLSKAGAFEPFSLYLVLANESLPRRNFDSGASEITGI